MSETTNNEHAATDVGSAPHRAPNNAAPRRRARWAAVVVALAVAGYLIIPRMIPVDVHDGFIAFEPDASLFPAAPVDNALTVSGIGRPVSLPNSQDGCPYGIGWGPDSWFGNEWNTVRHDWEQDGTAKTWIISEHTSGFDDLDEYDYYMDGFYNRTKYCGWGFDGVAGRGFNAVLTELDGLPDGAFAFTSEASPWNREDTEKFGDSNPDEFSALTAVIPGPKRGQVMFYTWLGWDAEVPRDEFVANVNAMYDAARNTPDPDGPSAGERRSQGPKLDLVPFKFSDSEMLQVVGHKTEKDGDTGLFSEYCERRGSSRLDIADVRNQEFDAVANDDREVAVSTAVIEDDASYLDAKSTVIRRYTPTCVDSVQDRRTIIEPTNVPGVPADARVAVWHDSGAYAAVVFDDDRRLIMVMAWNERSGDVPVDDFAEVLSAAWTQFQADNS